MAFGHVLEFLLGLIAEFIDRLQATAFRCLRRQFRTQVRGCCAQRRSKPIVESSGIENIAPIGGVNVTRPMLFSASQCPLD